MSLDGTALAERLTPAEARRRIAAQAQLNAFISVSGEEGDGPIVAVKDLIDVRGQVTTGGSRIPPAVPAAADAEIVARLRGAECVVIGKTNLHEWAYGSTSINPWFGPVRNPVDPERIAGGSSGGSAAAVAAGLCDWALGTDTAGSLRIPASLCGVASLKPSYGALPLEGVLPLSPSLDTVGPLAPDVAGLRTAYWLLTGEPPAAEIDGQVGPRLAAPVEGWVAGLDDTTARVWAAVTEALPRVSLPERERMSAVCTTISMYEASRVHRRELERRPEAFGPDIRERLAAGLGIPTEAYTRALAERVDLQSEVETALAGWDALLVPATARVAPPIGPEDVREPMTRFTRPFSATGQPVVTLPAKSPGLPVGIQVVGHWHRDAELLRVAAWIESEWTREAEPAGPA